MPPRMMTQSASRATATPRGGRMGGRADRGGGRTRGRSSDQGNGMIDGQGSQVGGQGSEVNDGVDEVPDFSTIITQQLQNLLPIIVAQVGSQGSDQGNGRNQKGDAVNDNIRGDVRNVIQNNDHRGCTYKEFLACNLREYDGKGGMSWEDFKTLTREEFCPSNEMQKLETELWNHAMVGASDIAYTNRFHELARENGGEPSKDRNGKDDNKRTRTGNDFATTTNPVRREKTGSEAKGNLHNQVVVVNGGQGRGNNDNQASGRVFILGAE
nr:reverse transcriptase domain-containing protein [Tanacetum cinerariifolium]